MRCANLHAVLTLLQLDVLPLDGGVGIGLGCAHLLAVHEELGSRSRGEDDDVGHILLALCEVLRAYA